MKVAILTDERDIARNLLDGLENAVHVKPGEKPPLDADVAVFFSGALSREWQAAYRERGAFVIDHSTPARMDPEIPNVVPHVNPEAMNDKIVASPNCATVILVTALKPLHDAFTIRRAVITTMQAVSGAGDAAADQFERDGGDAFPKTMAFNLHARIPQKHAPRPDGSTDEEHETVVEVREILGIERVTATCVRVPVRNAHGIAVHLELERTATREAALDVLRKAPLVTVWPEDDFPSPLDVSGKDDVHVGRVRTDASTEHGLALWIVGDNLRRGTSLNALDIVRAHCS